MNRHGRFRDSDLLRELFETTVRRCIEAGLVGGNGANPRVYCEHGFERRLA